MNPDLLALYADDSVAPLDEPPANGYVILTTAAIRSASAQLDDFGALREAQGFAVTVVDESEWGGGIGDTGAENMRAWLMANYIPMNIRYVLLIGTSPDSG